MRFDAPAGKASASFGFGQSFEEAIAAARARGVELPEDYYARIQGEMRRAATTVSGLAGLDQIQAVVDSFEAVLTGEQTLAEWVAWALLQNWGLSKGRMETVLRTNVQTAYGTGSWRSFERNKKTQPYLMWSAIDDSRVRPSHLAMDGYIAAVDDPIWRVWHPPAGYNSLLPWQRVSGRVFVGLKASYAGPVVEIVGQTGARLSVTAQHPILTSRGWIAAQDIQRGDQLVAYERPVRDGAVPADLHEDDPPPTIEEVFNALALRARGTMPRAALHLHGDAEFLDGDVEVVAADRELMQRVQAARPKGIDQFLFALAGYAARQISRACALLVIARRALRGFAAFAGGLQACGGSAPFTDRHASGLHVLRQALAVYAESRFKVAQGRALAVEIADHVRDRLPEPRWRAPYGPSRDEGGGLRFGTLGNTRFADVFIGGLEINPNALRDALQAHASSVQFEDVVDVRLSYWSGHVYDLETASGNILAYGDTGQRHYVISNCRCTQIALTEKQAIARGYGKQATPTVQPDPGFGNADGVMGGLRDAIQTRKAVCETGGKAIWCSGEGAQALARVERELDPE
mgnify:CR=1 FL=1